jgi:hypothetical protein
MRRHIPWCRLGLSHRKKEEPSACGDGWQQASSEQRAAGATTSSPMRMALGPGRASQAATALEMITARSHVQVTDHLGRRGFDSRGRACWAALASGWVRSQRMPVARHVAEHRGVWDCLGGWMRRIAARPRSQPEAADKRPRWPVKLETLWPLRWPRTRGRTRLSALQRWSEHHGASRRSRQEGRSGRRTTRRRGTHPP